MTKFKDLFLQDFGRALPEKSSVDLQLDQHTFFLRFDSRERIEAASYSGPRDHWLSSLCFLLAGKNLPQAKKLSLLDWEQEFKDDQFFWEMREEISQDIFFAPLELLRASLDLYLGREFLYQESSPMVCRCFGIREIDLKDATKAGMGCRSCVPDIKRILSNAQAAKGLHLYKDEPRVNWILKIDAKLNLYPEAMDWKMEIESFKKNLVVISYKGTWPQLEVERVGKDLQRFLAEEVDLGLSFFLRRSLQA
jgi:BFD-like [2Fe-2S] binding domain